MSEKHVEALVAKSAGVASSLEAMQFSQAAINASIALLNLKELRKGRIGPAEPPQ